MLRNAFAALLLVLFVWVCFPLLTPVAMGGVFALLFYPLFERIESRRVPSSVAAALITVAFSVLVLLPVSLLLIAAMKSGIEEFKSLQAQWALLPNAAGAAAELSEDGSWMGQLAHHPRVLSVVERLSRFFPIQPEELLATIADVLKIIGLKVGQWLGLGISRIPGMGLALVVAIVSLYFFLTDGRKLSTFVRRNSFYPAGQTDELLTGLGVMARSVVLASVASGLAQSIVMLVAMLVAGRGSAGMVAFLVFLASFVPLVGSAPVTIVVFFSALVDGQTSAAVILGVAAALAGLVDNLVRPWVLKGGANLHPLLGFVAAFGGLQLFGLSGLFLGPIVAGMFMAVLRLNSRPG